MSVNADALLRSLPDLPDVLAKIQSGLYTLCGGVVRHAPGTGKGGQIVGHLLFPGNALQTQESLKNLQSMLSSGLGSLQPGVGQLQQSMSVLQGLQSANLLLSGLNIAVTAVGFVVVCEKLNKISGQIEAQSQGIAQTLKVVGEIHDRGLLLDEARFQSLRDSARQFCECDDFDQLKDLIPKFHEQYHYNRLVLEKHAPIARSSLERLGEIGLLQDRLIHLGQMMSHVQMKIGAAKFGHECLLRLEGDLGRFNAQRVEALASDRQLASSVTQEQFAELTGFLQRGKQIRPALNYQADVITLEVEHPGVLDRASTGNQIMLLVA